MGPPPRCALYFSLDITDRKGWMGKLNKGKGQSELFDSDLKGEWPHFREEAMLTVTSQATPTTCIPGQTCGPLTATASFPSGSAASMSTAGPSSLKTGSSQCSARTTSHSFNRISRPRRCRTCLTSSRHSQASRLWSVMAVSLAHTPCAEAARNTTSSLCPQRSGGHSHG